MNDNSGFSEWLEEIRIKYGKTIPCPTMYHFAEFINDFWDGKTPKEVIERMR